MESVSLSPRPLRVVLPGGSGQVGRMLAHYFQQCGHHVTVLTRLPYTAPWQTVHWDGAHIGPWTEHLEGADVCIHVAGRSMNCRYTEANRREIYASRIGTTRLLNAVVANLAEPPRVWLNASTANIYRHAQDRAMDEATGQLGGNETDVPRGWHFAARMAKDWEAAFFETSTPRTRKVALRMALTLSPVPGNAFATLSNMVRLSLGGTQGNGRQFVSWIHEADFARAVHFLMLRTDLEGVFNVAAPHAVPNREFMAALREAWDVPNGVPVPAPLLEIAALLLRTETELVLKSRRVAPARLLQAGFAFQFPEWPQAAADLVRLWRLRSA